MYMLLKSRILLHEMVLCNMYWITEKALMSNHLTTYSN